MTDSGGTQLDTKLAGLLGGRTASAIQKSFGLVTVADLLSHYPRRYARRGELTALDRLPINENVTIVAEVRKTTLRQMKARKGSIFEVSLTDGVGFVSLTFFNQAWRDDILKPGMRGIFAGKISIYQDRLQLAHPTYTLFNEDNPEDERTADALSAEAKRIAEQPIPIYPASATVTSMALQKSIELVLDALDGAEDPVPPAVAIDRGLLAFDRALELVHRPQKDQDWLRARDSLRYQEAFVMQTALLQRRLAAHALKAAPRIAKPGGFLERFDAMLPFTLTADQQLVGSEIEFDLARHEPMNRLVQGEVGSGKTLVALRAMLATADSGGQSALLAPTEVLASQHLRSIMKILGPELSAELMPTLHTGQLPLAERKKAMLRMVSGQARIAIGTHALLSEKVTFFDLGLVVIDEQHRFGVEQRDSLRRKSLYPPHVLVLTATPIPRTVAMTVFGDLDISTITELPAGRQGITTVTVPLAEQPGWSSRIWTRMAEEIALGRQAFVVCPAIEAAVTEEPLEDLEEPELTGKAGRPPGPPKVPMASVLEMAERIRANPVLADYRIEALHGRMSSEEKDSVMQAFAAGDIDVVVATTVIEVGVDVPNASTMVVLDADRFGISQLHQLRGRVGRGGIPGLCLLVTRAEQETLARQRVEAVTATTDGFELAQADLELRREGNVLGLNQSGGRSSLRLLRVVADADLIGDARANAGEILDADPTLSQHVALREALARRLDEEDRAFLDKN
jgi:ATP-dependent DNA helicase RecG